MIKFKVKSTKLKLHVYSQKLQFWTLDLLPLAYYSI